MPASGSCAAGPSGTFQVRVPVPGGAAYLSHVYSSNDFD